jgi:hypothetical protein
VSGRSRRVAYVVDQGHLPVPHSIYLRISDDSVLSAFAVRVQFENHLFCVTRQIHVLQEVWSAIQTHVPYKRQCKIK